MAVALEGEDVGGEAIEEEAIVADYNRASGEILDRVFQRAERFDIKIIGRLVQQQDVAALFEASWPYAPGCVHRPTICRHSSADQRP